MKHIPANNPANNPDDDFIVEITSLDTPDTSERAHNGVLQGTRLAPRVRTWLTILSVVGGLLLVFVVLSPVLSSLLPKKTSAPPTFHMPPAQIEDVTVQNNTAYITSSDGTFRALSIKNGSLLWQRNLGGVVPVFINNTIYTASYSKQQSTVQALSAIDGSVLWTFKTSLDISPLIIDNGTVYTLFRVSPHGHLLAAFDSRSGAQLWDYTMNRAQLESVSIQGMQDKVYITTWANAQKPDTDLFVLKMSDGAPLWHINATNIQLIQDNLVSVTTDKGFLEMLRADNGHEVWQYKTANGASMSPATGNDLLYMQTLDGVLQALRADNGSLLWTYKDAWGVSEVFPEVNGVLYLETGDGFVVALRTSDGTRLWRVRPIPPPYTFGFVQVEGEIVYTFTSVGVAQDETVAALRASDGSVLWRRNVGTSVNNMLPQIINNQILTDSGSTITVSRASDGVVLWHANYVQNTLQYNSGFLALADNIMILRSSAGALEAHQLETGTVLWSYPRRTSS